MKVQKFVLNFTAVNLFHFRVTPILNIIQTFLNEPKLYKAVINLPVEKNFIGTVISVVTHPMFKYIESNANRLGNLLPEIERIVGTNFDPNSLFSNDRTLSNFGKVLCATPFPRSDDNLRIVDNVLNAEDFNGPDAREIRSLPSKFERLTSEDLFVQSFPVFSADFCRQLYKDVTSSNQGKITWNYIKPLIQGKILYGPDNEHTRSIVKNVSHELLLVSLSNSLSRL